jgi:phytol kinase
MEPERRARRSAFPDLDIVAALALVSFGWLALGTATGLNAVAFYGVTAIGMVMGLSAVALAGRDPGVRRLSSRSSRWSWACFMRWPSPSTPKPTTWNGPMWGLVLPAWGLPRSHPRSCPRVFRWRPGRMDHRVVAGLPLPAYLLPWERCHDRTVSKPTAPS